MASPRPTLPRLRPAGTKPDPRLSALLDLSTHLTATLDPSLLLGHISEAAVELFGAVDVKVLLTDERRGRLVYQPHFRLFPQLDLDEVSFAPGEGLGGWVSARGEPLYVAAVREDSRWVETDWSRGQPLGSFLGAPLLAEGRPLGALCLFTREARLFTAQDVRLLQALAHFASAAVLNARHYILARDRGERLGALQRLNGRLNEFARAAETMGSSLQLDRVLEAVVAASGPVVGADACVVAVAERPLWTGEPLRAAAHRGLGEQGARALGEERFPLCALALAEGRTVLHQWGEGLQPTEVERLGPGAEFAMGVALPLERREASRAALLLLYRRAIALADEEEALCSTFAHHAAIALQNARAAAELKARGEKAEAASRAKDQFLAMVNHELRNPLTVIQGAAQLLEAKADSEDRLRLLGHIRGQAARLGRLIGDLADITRIEAGKLDLRPEPGDLNSLVEEVLARFEGRLKTRFRVELDLATDLVPFPFDPVRIQQVLTNLVENAIKYSPEGGLLRVRTRRAVAEIRVEVTDAGRGIPPEDLPRIFERFRQVEEHRGLREGGVGLGLYLVQRLVELHGGRVWVESAPGEGSTFGFALPREGPKMGEGSQVPPSGAGLSPPGGA